MLIFLKREDPEIERAFMCLPGGPSAECLAPDCGCGEVWGYMGTVCFDGKWKHEFRHRHFNERGRKYFKIDTPGGWEPKVFRTLGGDYQGV